MPNYQNGKIYCVRCMIDEKMIYVGSTTVPLCKRWWEHKWGANNKSNVSICILMKDMGVENFYIELYELFPCNSKQELEKREGEVMREIATVNKIKNIGIYSSKEETSKAYRFGKKREEILQKKRDYHHKNKEAIAIKQKERRDGEKREEILQKKKEAYYKDKEAILEKRKQIKNGEKKEELLQKRREYYHQNKIKILEQQKEYYARKNTDVK